MYDSFSKPELTGTLIFRDAQSPAKLPAGKKMMAVIGIVVVDDDFQISGESVVRVRAQGAADAVHMQTEPRGNPLDPKYLGWELGELFKEPLWKA